MNSKEKNKSKDEIAINSLENNYQKEYEILEIKKKLNSIHNDLKKMIEQSNQDYFNKISLNLKNEFINSINGYMLEKTDETLNQRMIDSCDMKNQCKNIFKKYLNKHTKDLNPENIEDKKVGNGREELKNLRKVMKDDKCNICFDEVSDMFENHMNLISSLKIYETQDENNEKEISAIDEESIVKNILDPISNKQRLQILKSIALEPKTFSDLSKITGLRGGNLLFHIQKLQNTNLILQKHERGEYILTKKGFRIISILTNMKK